MRPMMIGDLTRLTGTKVNTIRFYEDIGLLPPGRADCIREAYLYQRRRRLTHL